MPIYYRDDNNIDVVDTDGSSASTVATNIIWAFVALVLIGALIWATFYSGLFDKVTDKKMDVDVNISAPAVPRR